MVDYAFKTYAVNLLWQKSERVPTKHLNEDKYIYAVLCSKHVSTSTNSLAIICVLHPDSMSSGISISSRQRLCSLARFGSVRRTSSQNSKPLQCFQWIQNNYLLNLAMNLLSSLPLRMQSWFFSLAVNKAGQMSVLLDSENPVRITAPSLNWVLRELGDSVRATVRMAKQQVYIWCSDLSAREVRAKLLSIVCSSLYSGKTIRFHQNSAKTVLMNSNVFIYGWRRKALYILCVF